MSCCGSKSSLLAQDDIKNNPVSINELYLFIVEFFGWWNTNPVAEMNPLLIVPG